MAPCRPHDSKSRLGEPRANPTSLVERRQHLSPRTGRCRVRPRACWPGLSHCGGVVDRHSRRRVVAELPNSLPRCPSPSPARSRPTLRPASQILWPQAGMLGDPSQDARSEFLVIVEGEHDVGPALAFQSLVRPGLPLDPPASPQERCEHASRLSRRPATHAASNRPSSSTVGSPCSSLSASTRRARALAPATAASRVAP
jgi:hypothetical protein